METQSRLFKISLSFIGLTALLSLGACSGSKESAAVDAAEVAMAPGLTLSEDALGENTQKEKKVGGCSTPEFAQDPLCRPVLVGAEGPQSQVGNLELNGSFKLEYNADGSLAKMLHYHPTQTQRPDWVRSLSYNAEGQIETVTIEEEENLLASDFDRLEKKTLFYSNGKLEREEGTKSNPSQPYAPSLTTRKVYQKMTPSMMGSVYTETDHLNQTKVQVDKYEAKFGSWNYDLTQRFNWAGSLHSMIVQNGEAKASSWNGATNTKMEVYAYCDANVGMHPDCDVKSSNFDAQYTVSTTYQYEGGKLIGTLTQIDGDRQDLANHPADNHIDRKIPCQVEYEEESGPKPYELPSELRAIGLSADIKIRSIDCQEPGQAQTSFVFKYEPLWKAIGAKEPGTDS